MKHRCGLGPDVWSVAMLSKLCGSLTKGHGVPCSLMLLSYMQDLATWLRLAVEELRLRGGQDHDDHTQLQAAREHGMHAEGNDAEEVVIAELRDRMMLQKSQQEATDTPSPRQFSIRWYQANRNKTIAPGSTVTVLQACYCMTWLKMRGNMTSYCLDMICRMLASGGMLPVTNNLMPRYDLSIPPLPLS